MQPVRQESFKQSIDINGTHYIILIRSSMSLKLGKDKKNEETHKQIKFAVL